jgi:Ca2+-binding RTX toxin-like protein
MMEWGDGRARVKARSAWRVAMSATNSKHGRRVIRLGILLSLAAAANAPADIDLAWRPLQQTVGVGDSVALGLYAISDTSESQYFSAAQTVLAWDAEALLLTGLDTDGGVGLFSSTFPENDAFGLNEANPPADGNALWVGLALGVLPATPAGSLLTTVTFAALQPEAVGSVAILPSGGDPTGYTKVIGAIPNQDVLGSIGPAATVTIVPEPAVCGMLLIGVLSLRRLR